MLTLRKTCICRNFYGFEYSIVDHILDNPCEMISLYDEVFGPSLFFKKTALFSFLKVSTIHEPFSEQRLDWVFLKNEYPCLRGIQILWVL